MDKHEYRVKTEKMLEYMSQKSYKQAMDIADMIDWRKVKNVSMLSAVSEIYEANKEYQKSRDVLFLAYDRSPDSRKVIYRLGTLALKLGDVKEAVDCYEEFVALAPKDPNRYVFKYKILKSQSAPLEEQIEVLEEFKKVEYVEKWAFELAKLYQSAGMTSECIEECDDLILWFSEGKYVYNAMELKMQYKALTPLQQEKYNLRFAKPEPVAEKPAVEEQVVEEPEVEEVSAAEVYAEEPVQEEPVQEQPVQEEPTQKELSQEEQEEEVKVETIVEEKKETPTLSIEEMLQEWESKQKENAEMIRAEVEKAEQEKAEMEKAQEESASEPQEEEESILSDDIRQLMEALETESADIEAQKIKQDDEPEMPEEDKPLIQNLNLQVEPGQRIAIVGPTGCGKTTLINLLMRFYDVSDGTIRTAGKDIREVSRKSLRGCYGMVLQDTWLKAGTVRENIAYGDPDATEEQIIAAAKAAHAHSFIRRLPDGYDTVIAENGENLSAGQRQLLCIARAMLKLPPMLILDEATSSIDTRTELKIQDAFSKMMQGRTSFIVAHRLSTIRSADVILVMKDGNIIEQGNHESLLAQKGFYANLYESQFTV